MTCSALKNLVIYIFLLWCFYSFSRKNHRNRQTLIIVQHYYNLLVYYSVNIVYKIQITFPFCLTYSQNVNIQSFHFLCYFSPLVQCPNMPCHDCNLIFAFDSGWMADTRNLSHVSFLIDRRV